MEDVACVRCLFCEAGHEATLARIITDSGLGLAIFPQKVKRLYRRGIWADERMPLLPGYVFVYSDASAQYEALARIPHVLRVLRYQQDGDGCLHGRDRLFADWILRCGGTIGVLDAIQVGGFVEIVDGLFKQLHGTVVQLDKRKQIAKVRLDVVGDVRTIWLSYRFLDAYAAEQVAKPVALRG